MQHVGRVSSKQNLGKKVSSLDRSQSVRRAKERANLDKGSWEQLNWYVNFTKLNFDSLSDGDILNIQDEVAALCSIVEGHSGGRPLLSLKRLKSTQLEISIKLSNLVDHHQADFGSFTYTVVVNRLRELMAKSPDFEPEALRDIPKVNISKRFSPCKTPEKMIVIILMSHLIDLLGEFGQAIVRCLKCHQLFLQFRQHSKYCSRECQSREAMKNLREKKKAQKIKSKTSTSKPQGFKK